MSLVGSGCRGHGRECVCRRQTEGVQFLAEGEGRSQMGAPSPRRRRGWLAALAPRNFREEVGVLEF
jgi:hypothetical protein